MIKAGAQSIKAASFQRFSPLRSLPRGPIVGSTAAICGMVNEL